MVENAISKGTRRHQNAKCFNLGRTSDKEFLGIISPLGMAKIEGPSIQVYVKGVAKAKIKPMNADQQQTDKATSYHQETP